MSFRKKLFQTIQSQLLKQVPGIASIDRYNGQNETIQAGESIPYPPDSVFIELRGGSWKARAGRTQRTSDNYQIVLWSYSQTFLDSHNKAADQSASLQDWDMLDDLANALEGFCDADTCLTSLTLVGDQLDTAYAQHIFHTLTFNCGVYDIIPKLTTTATATKVEGIVSPESN